MSFFLAIADLKNKKYHFFCPYSTVLDVLKKYVLFLMRQKREAVSSEAFYSGRVKQYYRNKLCYSSFGHYNKYKYPKKNIFWLTVYFRWMLY